MLTKIAHLKEIEIGQKKRLMVNDEAILLANINGVYHAVSDTCTHQKASLSAGVLSGCQIECPWHGAKFDLTTGKPTTLPAVLPLKKYQVEIQGEDILIEI